MKPTTERWRRLVAEIEAVAAPGGRARHACASLEGLRLFERALRAGARIDAAVVSRAFLDDGSERARALRARLEEHGCELALAPGEVMERLTGGRSLGGLVGLVRLPATRTLAELLAESAGRPPRLLVAVGLNDPGNVGALVRTAHAAGATALLAVGATDAFHPKAVRTSMGSVFRLPVLAWPALDALVADLSAAGVRTLGAVTDGGAALACVPLPERPTAIVLGSEAFGLSEQERAQLDGLVTLPMADGVDSLSVNAAAAVLLYHFSGLLGRRRS